MPQTISSLAIGRRFFDAIPHNDDFVLRFVDGLEITVAWASEGPEVKSHRFALIPAICEMHPQFRYVSGKRVKSVLTDGKQLIIGFDDGHELRSDFRREPQPVAVDAKIILEPVSVFGSASL